MVPNCLLEMSLFAAAKETDNKLRWDADVEGTNFAFYIPKWRVPSPWPSRIWVDIIPRRAACDDLPNLSPSEVQTNPSLKHESIIATVVHVQDHTKTVRYCPVGEHQSWEIGEPYVPFELIPNRDDRLRIAVLWDVTSRGLFQGRTT